MHPETERYQDTEMYTIKLKRKGHKHKVMPLPYRNRFAKKKICTKSC